MKDFVLDILFLAQVIMGCCGWELFEGLGCKEEDVTDSGEKYDVSAKGKVGDMVYGEFGDTFSGESLDTLVMGVGIISCG